MMSIWKPSRILLVVAAVGAMARISQAGCNCSVPPSPGAFSGAFGGSGWSGMAGYGGYGNYGTAGYSGYGNYGMAGYGGMPGYDGMIAGPMSPGSMSAAAYPGIGYGAGNAYGAPAYNPNGATWAPGGYEGRVGSPVYYHDPAGGQYVVTGNPYYDHFGPGFQRNSLYGHYRFPYYNYRAPWYYSGKAVYNRDTNFPW